MTLMIRSIDNFFLNFFILVLLISIGACSNDAPLSPEQKVKEVLEKVELAAERRSLSGMMEHVSGSYVDHKGYSKADIQRLSQMQFIARQNINIFSVIRSLEIVDGVAAVEMSVAMAGRDVDLTNENNRLRADTIKFSIVLQSENDNWMISSVSWEQGW